MTYTECYQKTNGHEIKDLKQPLLIVTPTKKHLHRGRTENIFLTPELCKMTGFTDQMRKNFTLMKELPKHLYVGPQEWVKEINHVMKRLTSEIEVCV